MNIKMFLLLSAVFFWGMVKQVSAQQYPSIGFFTHTQLLLNPAYAGSGEGIRGAALYRNQWTGIKGSPSTQVVNVDGALGRGVGLGLSLSRDHYSYYSQYDILPNFSYRINLGPESYVQAGLRVGLSIVNYGNNLFQWDANDPLRDDQVKSGVLPRFGTGLFYKSPKVFLGLSAPDVVSIDSKKIFYDEVNKTKTIYRNYIFTGGLKLSLTEYIAFVPNTMVRYYPKRPLYAALNAGFELNQTIVFGVGYIYTNGIAAYTLIGITPKLKAGYRFEYSPSSSDIGKFATNEIMISYGIH